VKATEAVLQYVGFIVGLRIISWDNEKARRVTVLAEHTPNGYGLAGLEFELAGLNAVAKGFEERRV
jgi:hypothetical protein